MYKQEPPETLSVREVAAIYNVHELTVRRHINEGRLRAVRVGRSIRVRREDLAMYEQQMQPKQPKPRARTGIIEPDDPIWGIVGMGASGGGNWSENKHELVAQILWEEFNPPGDR